MTLSLLNFTGRYGKSDQNTCQSPSGPASGRMEIQYNFNANSSTTNEPYTLVMYFNSAAQELAFCNVDPTGQEERNFTLYVPMDYHPHFAEVMAQLGGAPKVVVGTHAFQIIDFIFAPA